MIDKLRKLIRKDDGVSAVIGTILMIAATVILGGVIYAAVGGFGSEEIGQTSSSGVFKLTAVNADLTDTPTDSIRIALVSAPETLADVKVAIKTITGVDALAGTPPMFTTVACDLTTAGNSCVFVGEDVTTYGEFIVTITVGKTVALDQKITLG